MRKRELVREYSEGVIMLAKTMSGEGGYRGKDIGGGGCRWLRLSGMRLSGGGYRKGYYVWYCFLRGDMFLI